MSDIATWYLDISGDRHHLTMRCRMDQQGNPVKDMDAISQRVHDAVMDACMDPEDEDDVYASVEVECWLDVVAVVRVLERRCRAPLVLSPALVNGIRCKCKGPDWQVDASLQSGVNAGPTKSVTSYVGGPADPGVVRRLEMARDAVDGAIAVCVQRGVAEAGG